MLWYNNAFKKEKAMIKQYFQYKNDTFYLWNGTNQQIFVTAWWQQGCIEPLSNFLEIKREKQLFITPILWKIERIFTNTTQDAVLAYAAWVQLHVSESATSRRHQISKIPEYTIYGFSKRQNSTMKNNVQNSLNNQLMNI